MIKEASNLNGEKKISSPKKYFILFVILVLLVVAILIMSAVKPQIEAVKAKPKTWSVNAMAIEVKAISPVYSLLGKVESSSLVKASSPVSGVVANAWVQEGDSFVKGQKLVSLAKEDLQLAVGKALASVAISEAKLSVQELSFAANKKNLKHELSLLAIKKKNVSRNQKLSRKRLISASSVEIAKESLVRQQKVVVAAKLVVAEHDAKLIEFKSNLNTANINLTQARINLRRGELVAPFNGKVTKLLVTAGDRVNVGSALISFYANDSLELRAKIPNVYLNSLQKTIGLGEMLSASYVVGNQTYFLAFDRFAGESSARGLDAFLTLPKNLNFVSPGSLMNVSLQAPKVANVFAVPFSALYGADKIFLIDNETSELVSKVVKKIGENSAGEVLLKGDLKTGDKILTTHLPNAIRGLKVVIVEQEAH